MGADEEIHQDKGKPKANTTCRIRVAPNTLHTKPMAVATIQGQGASKDVLLRGVKKVKRAKVFRTRVLSAQFLGSFAQILALRKEFP